MEQSQSPFRHLQLIAFYIHLIFAPALGFFSSRQSASTPMDVSSRLNATPLEPPASEMGIYTEIAKPGA
jgi:hypothetical protein